MIYVAVTAVVLLVLIAAGVWRLQDAIVQQNRFMAELHDLRTKHLEELTDRMELMARSGEWIPDSRAMAHLVNDTLEHIQESNRIEEELKFYRGD